MYWIRKIMPHVSIVCALMLTVLYILNIFNDTMGFLRGTEFSIVLIITILSSLCNGIFLLQSNWRNEEEKW